MKPSPQKKPQRKQKVKMRKHKLKRRTQQQEQIVIMLEVERMRTGSMMIDCVETAKEAGGRHRGRPVLCTVSEDDDLIVFHNDHVEHDMNDGLDEN